jgi:4-alpha-glucanotransferase
MAERVAGVLLHPTSLPGRFGIGDLGPGADSFLEWARAAGLGLWQVLPLGPTAFGNSPYGCLSAFAGNPLLISPEELLREGLLSEDDLADAPLPSNEGVDFEAVIPWKEALLRGSYRKFASDRPLEIAAELEEFASAPEQASWLEDWALFSALKWRFGGREWTAWPRELALRSSKALERARNELAEEIELRRYLQMLFFRQWGRVRREATLRGVQVMGDLPIYVAADSADVWAHRRLFALDADGKQLTVAGVPPDYFSKTGQRWGNPIYRWDRMQKEGFAWWVERIRANLRTADLVRLDHFRGFVAFWEVAAGEETAVNGRWVKGPGEKLFIAIRKALGEVPLVAEDLGVITDDVRSLLATLGLPGMKVLQFAFGGDDEEYQPHRHVANGVVYTGTHDNDTTRGWWEATDEETRKRAREYLGTDGREIAWDLVRTAYTSVADRVVMPAADLFGLGNEARMNTPGNARGNWGYRARASDLTPERAARLRRLGSLTGRLPVKG